MAQGKKESNGATELGYEARLWKIADALRNNMDAAEYKHVVLGLNFLCCGSGGRFLSSEGSSNLQAGEIDDASPCGQESNRSSRRGPKPHLTVRRIYAHLPQEAN
ncbi:MAG: type I restriction-modification system subunit M N-terminal domain-containing protein [Rhodocyclaceae bacterium]|nr:type I restriction-modification system subunit M N-terminal domain-containing protein [Rhodocyclaceae bacterium]